MVYGLAIVGLGPAGLFTLASLPNSLLNTTVLIEQSCIGGELASHYGNVIANITKAEFLSSLTSIPRWGDANCPELDAYADTSTPPLYVLINILRRLSRPLIQQAHFHTCSLQDLTQLQDGWGLHTTVGTIQANKVILCMGATPKTLNFPIPAIPLHVALGPTLNSAINPNDTIVVFGTSHSGTLVLKQLKDLGATSVYAVHTGISPFHSDLKHEAQTITREILTGVWEPYTPTFISYTDTPTLYRTLSKASAVIYAIGFAPRSLCPMPAQGLKDLLRLGYCDPTQKDIGFAAFIQTIQERLHTFLA
jgi:cation diffusion facilitator CzcD-associated flavoprotein CzcO